MDLSPVPRRGGAHGALPAAPARRRSTTTRPGHVAMLLENHLELLALYGGCAYAGLTLFGVNTGPARRDARRRAQPVARPRAGRRRAAAARGRARARAARRTSPPENILVLRTAGRRRRRARPTCAACVDARGRRRPASRSTRPPSTVDARRRNLMVIYTSGTTGLPKGINNNHFKLLRRSASASRRNLGLGQDDVGYACMPLFHSNAMFVGFMPAFWVGGSARHARALQRQPVRARRASRYGVTFWNYVGEPVHYVLGGDREAVRRRRGAHPRRGHRTTRRTRCATRSATAPRRPTSTASCDWFGLEDMFELYGSTEAAISTFRRKGDPRGSVGEITDPAVKILNEQRRRVPARRARRRRQDHSTTSDARRRDLPRRAPTPASSRATSTTPTPTRSKYRDGVYHSGDLGHVLVRDGKRYLYFDGRTDDWIRKDGENFSALQVARLLQEHPDVALAAAYGVPCAVSDELVMAALKLRDGARFDPQGVLRLLRARRSTRRQHGPQVVPRLRAHRRRVRVHADAEGPGAQPEEGALRPPPPARRSRSTGGRAADRLPALHGRGLRRPARRVREGRARWSCSTGDLLVPSAGRRDGARDSSLRLGRARPRVRHLRRGDPRDRAAGCGRDARALPRARSPVRLARPVLDGGVPLGDARGRAAPRLARDGAAPVAGVSLRASASRAWSSSRPARSPGVWLLALVPLQLLFDGLGIDRRARGAALARPRAVRRRGRVGRDLAPARGRDRARRAERREPARR